MCFFMSLILGTIFAIIGYYVLLSTTKTEGAIKKTGKMISIWIFVFAFLILITGSVVALANKCPMEKMMQQKEMMKK